MSFSDSINIVSTVVSIISLIIVVVQLISKKELKATMKTQMQTHYNIYYQIARICTRVRDTYEDPNLDLEKKVDNIYSEMSIIRGTADTARTNIISYSRESFNYVPFYEHPAFPNKEMSENVKMGYAPEKEIRNQSIEQ